MSHSDRLLDSLEERLKFAWKVLRKFVPEGAYVREIAPQILGIESPTPEQSRTVGMTMKAMASRGMAEVVDGKRRAKDPVKWRAVEKKKWKPVIQNHLSAAKTEADKEQADWYYSVVREANERKRFREMMADRL